MAKSVVGLNWLVCLLALALVAAAPARDGRYGVLSPAGMDAAAIVAAAGARIVSISPDGRFAVAWSADDGLGWRLLSNGAVLIFNPVLALGCRS